MVCIQSLITTKIKDVRKAIDLLTAINNDDYWNIPENHPSMFQGILGGVGLDSAIKFEAVSSLEFNNVDGHKKAKESIPFILTQITLFLPMVNQPNGRFSLQQDTITATTESLKTAQTELQKLVNNRFFDQYWRLKPYDELRLTGEIIGGGDKLSKDLPVPIPQMVRTFTILKDELTERDNARNSLISGIDELKSVLDYISASDCSEPPKKDESDNCDRIATALEAIAKKEFVCDTEPILLAIEELKKLLGNEFTEGIKVPKMITQPPKDNKPTDKDYITIKSMPEFMIWQFKQIDALIGRFPIEIIQKDSDITEEGDQETKIIIPNLSEGIAELIGMNAVALTNSDATLKSSISNLGESVQAKQMLVQCRAILDNLVEWAGMTIREKTIKLPVSAKLTATKLEDFLTNDEMNVVVDDYQPSKNGNEFDIDKIGMIVNTIYAIISAIYVKPIDKNNPKESITNDLKKMRDGMTLIDGEDEDTLSVFLERAEIGFTDTPLTENKTNPKPYGRDRDRRPKIRRTEGMDKDDIDDNGGNDGNDDNGEGG